MTHLTTDEETSKCGRPVGEMSAEAYTTDPESADCFECQALLGRPQDAAAVAVAYGQGYADGKEKAFFELENWRPGDHHCGCACQLCTLAKGILNKVLGQQTWR